MVLNGIPIRADEVEEAASTIALIEPQDSLLQLRRIATTNLIFPRIVARTIDPEARERARATASAWKQVLESGTLPAGPVPRPLAIEREGGLSPLGFDLWRAALEAPIGPWSEVIEAPGVYHVFQVVERSAGNTPGLVQIRVRVYDFPYLDPATGRAALEDALDRSKLSIVDEGWRDAVPTAWQHRMREGSSR